ncbi:MAG: relaxase domain-containing protein [Gammaproteobacteria bacterium]|nr:relaxase domain-containing protein [Gammaproteobacteria bacterium]
MLAQPKLTSSDSARNYFERDTYYINNAHEQGSFYGKLKDDLGLGDFNLEDFDKLLMAKDLEGNQLLRLTSKDFDENGERKRAACDLTFAADKDISILYEVSGDEMKDKIRAAFNRSIDKALDFAEENYSYTKDRNNMKGKKADSKMLFTRFDHSESRNDDMHLHVHALAMNMIQDENGNWKAVEFNQIMENHQLLGQIQRNEFAKELQTLGVELEISSVKNGTFKTKAVEQEVRDMFSTRSKDIKEEMAKSGQHSYKATHTAQKQTAKWKDKNKDREQIQADNIQRLEDAGADIEKIKELKEDLKIRQLDERAVMDIAISDITDKKSVFKKEDVLKHALKVGLLSNVDVNLIAQEFEKYSDLVVIDREKNQFTTLEVLEKEEFIFNLKNQENFSITQDKEQIATAINEFEAKKGFELKQGQNELAHTVLSSESKYIVAQGVAGAGKSTSLEIVKNVAEQNGINVVALAPTGTATDNLAKEAGIKESYTVAKFLKENGAGIKDALVIIDEAGMLGLRDTHDLMKIAEENNLKIVFSGDMNQKKSISQGDIFAGMQRQGFQTINLAEGNRQKNDKMKLAVKNILDKDIVAGLEILKDTTREITNSDERLKDAQEEYLKDKDNSLLITTTNSDRVKLNQTIRDELISQKEIKHSKEFDLRETINLSDLEKRSALHYQKEQKVFLSKNIGSISAGREAVIKDVNIDKNQIIIEHQGKNKTFTETVDLTESGDKLNLFEDTKKELGIGEKVMMKKNDKKLGLSNGQMGVITQMYKDRVTVKFDKKEVSFSTNQYKYINHAYAITDFASQGKTTDKVIAVANSQAASFNDFYTQITRAKHEAVIITDNLKELQERAARYSVKLNASELIKNKENDMRLNAQKEIEDKLRQEQQAQKEREREQAQKEAVQVQEPEQKKEDENSFIDTIDKASDLYDLVETARDVIEGNPNEIIQNLDDLNLVNDMAVNHSMKSIDKSAFTAFKDMIKEVYKEAISGDLDFTSLLQETVKSSMKFVKQLAHTKENSMEM